jgi:hypothetical protein
LPDIGNLLLNTALWKTVRVSIQVKVSSIVLEIQSGSIIMGLATE